MIMSYGATNGDVMWTMSVVVAPASAVTAPAPLKGPISKTVRRAAEIGYDAVQVTVHRPAEFDLNEARRALNEHRLRVTSIGTGAAYSVDGISLGHGDADKRMAAVERMKQHVRLAADLGGANVVIGMIRGRLSDSTDRHQFMSDYRESVAACIDHAGREGITILHEAMGGADSDVLRSIDENVAFLESFSSPQLRLHVDCHHMNQEESDWASALRRAREWIGQVDICDVERGVPDGRHFDFPRLVSTLREIGYAEYLAFEYNSVGSGVPEARAGLEYIKSLT
jgi:D-psicose/D-tagatose/L-ribulose 3-epimerase